MDDHWDGLNIYNMAEALCIKYGVSWEEYLDYYESYGYIYSGPGWLVMCEYKCIDGELALFVPIALGEGCIRMMLNAMPMWCDKIAFARLTRNRSMVKTHSTERVCRLFGVTPELLKLRCL